MQQFKRYDLNESSTFVLPEVDFDGKSQRVIYTLYEYTELIDSSNMDHHDYRQMAADILNGYDFFDGFVILHGTDTMAYSSAALSFMLRFVYRSYQLEGLKFWN